VETSVRRKAADVWGLVSTLSEQSAAEHRAKILKNRRTYKIAELIGNRFGVVDFDQQWEEIPKIA
jgi:hypothetical protein